MQVNHQSHLSNVKGKWQMISIRETIVFQIFQDKEMSLPKNEDGTTEKYDMNKKEEIKTLLKNMGRTNSSPPPPPKKVS
jgi:hypothetical protein